MTKELVTRRRALGTILKTAAVAAGVSVVDLGFLSKEAHAATITSLKVLKVKLSGYNKSVFESEFGRSTPLAPLRSISGLKPLADRLIKPGQALPGNLMGCQANFGSGAMGAGACPALEGCVFNSSSCPVMGECVGANVCSGQDVGGGGGSGGSGPDSCTGVNDCNGQDCSTLSSCGDNECGGQKCPKLAWCGENEQSMTECLAHTGALAGTLTQFQTDSYVQGLFKYFNVTTVGQLAVQVNTMLRQRRILMPSQVIK